ncbi:MAG: class I SAM-dependent methyltransferase [Tardiphaga sp.]|nr:class I SAM-dependent methyltransferase [Tardiphaga sp.]
MTGFSAEWLTLREPHDLRARNSTVIEAVATFLELCSSVQIVDLACGTGSTLRALNPFLPMRQNWKLVDNDLSLLARATASPRDNNATLSAVPLDLNRDLEAVLDGVVDLVATSALLDLVSETWLDRLVVEMVTRAIPLYAALSYDGRIALTPHDPLDVAIIAAVNAHQRTDKGFGPALGPAAAALAIARFEALGYSVVRGTSDWVIGPDAPAMQSELLAGWANAAREVDALPRAEISAWLRRRRDLVAAGRSELRVGHADFFATPKATR